MLLLLLLITFLHWMTFQVRAWFENSKTAHLKAKISDFHSIRSYCDCVCVCVDFIHGIIICNAAFYISDTHNT